MKKHTLWQRNYMSSPAYNVKSVILVESQFSRAHEVSDLNKSKKTFSIDIETAGLEDNNFNVLLSVNFYATAEDHDEHEVDFSVKMAGLFEKVGDASLIPNEYFVNVNAPAIIFPFVREHIASTTAKAGIEAVLLPPFNFVENYQRRETENQEVTN